MKLSGAEIIIKSLIAEQVSTIFGYPGGANMPLYDALYRYDSQLRHILVRHEQGAAHAAEGYARATGKTGVCFATSGPGATNLVTGIADAMMDSIPLVCITGQVAAHLIGTNAFQETDIVNITKPITKWNIQVTKADQIEEAIHTAFFHANTGRPGPVLIDIAKSAQLEMGEYAHKKRLIRSEQSVTHSHKNDFTQAAYLINSAKKPLIIVGHGVLISKAKKEIIELIDKAQIPVACTLLGVSAIPSSHPLFVGMVGMHGNVAPNVLTNEADVIVAIGMRFDDRVTSTISTYAKKAKIIHIDIDKREINKNIKGVVSIVSDAKIALQTLIPHIIPSDHKEWQLLFKDKMEEEKMRIVDLQTHPKLGKLRMAEVIHELSILTEGKSVIVSDVGQNQMMAARYYRFETFDQFYTSGGLGTMGFSLPAAIGATIGAPDKTVISINGDGGFQMNIQELGTIAQEQLSVKILILNNGYLGMVRQWQQLFFDKRYSFTTMQSPDFIAVGKAYGIKGKRVSQRAKLKNALSILLAHKGPYILEVDVEQEGNVFPMIAPGASVSDIRLS